MIQPIRHMTVLAGTLAASLALVGSAVQAQSVESFYRGKTLTLIVFTSSGGTSDAVARMVAEAMPKHIPGNPTIIVKNMVGGGGMVAANYLYNVAPRDGTVFGTLNRPTPFAPLLDLPNVKFDSRKFNWIGSEGKDVMLGVSWFTSGVKTLKDAQEKELMVGSDGPTTDLAQIPLGLNATTGTKFKVVYGYSGGSEVLLAMERGELGGRIGWTYDSLFSIHPDWVREHKINLLLQAGLKRDPRIPDVPLALDYARTPLERSVLELFFTAFEISRPYVLPPEVPPARMQALRDAFWATMKDPDFIAASQKAHLDVAATDAAEVVRLIDRIYAMPPDVIVRAKEVFGGK